MQRNHSIARWSLRPPDTEQTLYCMENLGRPGQPGRKARNTFLTLLLRQGESPVPACLLRSPGEKGMDTRDKTQAFPSWSLVALLEKTHVQRESPKEPWRAKEFHT